MTDLGELFSRVPASVRQWIPEVGMVGSGILGSIAYGCGYHRTACYFWSWSGFWVATRWWVWYIHKERDWLRQHFEKMVEAKAAEMAAGAIMQGMEDDDSELARYESDVKREDTRLQKDVATGFQAWSGKKKDGEDE